MSQQPLLPFDAPPAPLPRHQRKRKADQGASSVPVAAREIAFNKIKHKRGSRHHQILRALTEHGPQTARQLLRLFIAQGLLPVGSERNMVSPRISEMADAGCVEAIDELRQVGNDAPAAAWRVTARGKILFEELERKQRDGSTK